MAQTLTKCATCDQPIYHIKDDEWCHAKGIVWCDHEAMRANNVDPEQAAHDWIDTARP